VTVPVGALNGPMVTVPVGALNGPITVTTNGVPGVPSSASLTIVPAITSFSPTIVGIGESFTVTGTNFSTTASANMVTFTGGVSEIPTVSTATSLTVTVPGGAATGPIFVTCNGVPGAPSSASLTVGVTINFSGLVSGQSVPSYTQNGYTLTGLEGSTPCSLSPYYNYCIIAREGPTPPAMGVFLGGAQLDFELTRDGGGTFALYSLMLSPMEGRWGGPFLTFTGTLASGGTVTETVQPGFSYGYQTFSFPSTFTNLVSLRWYPDQTLVSNVIVTQ
jgi:hypothetical protein